MTHPETAAPVTPPSAPPSAPEARDGTGPASRPHHGHLWRLADGTGLHAPPAALVIDPETGRLCCHLCGHFFRSLGSHVRAHGHTADTYREEMGLCRGEALTDGTLSAAISERQRDRFAASEDVHLQLSVGRRSPARERRPTTSAAAARQAEARATGRATRRSEQQAALAGVVVDAGFPDLASMLRSRYVGGASLESLAAETGLGRSALRNAMEAAGVVLRAQGQNTDAGRRARVRRAEVAAAARVGTDDLPAWLRIVGRRAGRWRSWEKPSVTAVTGSGGGSQLPEWRGGTSTIGHLAVREPSDHAGHTYPGGPMTSTTRTTLARTAALAVALACFSVGAAGVPAASAHESGGTSLRSGGNDDPPGDDHGGTSSTSDDPAGDDHGGTRSSGRGGDDRVIRASDCTGSADWKVKVKSDDGRLEVEGEIDSNAVGQRWRWTIRHNGSVSDRGTATTTRPQRVLQRRAHDRRPRRHRPRSCSGRSGTARRAAVWSTTDLTVRRWTHALADESRGAVPRHGIRHARGRGGRDECAQPARPPTRRRSPTPARSPGCWAARWRSRPSREGLVTGDAGGHRPARPHGARPAAGRTTYAASRCGPRTGRSSTATAPS